LSKANDHITVFEHETIRFDKGENRISKELFDALQHYYGQGVPYYSLCYNGIKFNSYVGVIQIGKTLIEILPKADKIVHTETAEITWRNVLINMLKAVGSFDIKSTSQSNLKIKPNTILDLYFELFIKEIEYLLHNGLAKKYRKKEGNVNALKGSLQFGKHLQQNLTHKERFYVRYTTYDLEHSLHCIIYKTLKLLKQINTNTNIHGRILSLLLNFPEMPDLKVSEITFDKIVLNRKTQGYKNAIDIARLLLLHYHPDLSKGRNNVLALMFDMNLLWEQFVLISLKKDRNLIVKGQNSKYFWKSINGKRRTIRPDIIVRKEDTNYVIDTKWKLVNSQPSIEDIRQMYAYHHYFKAQKVALLYPGPQEYISGSFINIDNQNNLTNLECGLIFIDFETDINKWQNQIRAYLLKWINTSKEI
jgi:5-methylcytosine-specific restriction enzyme subunit McrC